MRVKAAAWWRTSSVWSHVGVMSAAVPLGLFGGCYDDFSPAARDPSSVATIGQPEGEMRALELQTRAGWDVGSAETPLHLSNPVPLDAADGVDWVSGMYDLPSRLRPTRKDLVPWNVPTLFQSLAGPAGASLRAQMWPVRSAELDEAFARGTTLWGLFSSVGWPCDTALVIDANGPRSIAVAAALADHFDPVFTFGNWPHPVGVVKAQETLAAALYYLPVFDDAARRRAPSAPPMWVLDSDRLLPYEDEDTRFDNRYVVRLPNAATLRAMGIKHVMYVNHSGTELDDLNQPFVDLAKAGIGLRLVTLRDLVRTQQYSPLCRLDDEDDPRGAALLAARLAQQNVSAAYLWGGSSDAHAHFWDGGWYPTPGWAVAPPSIGGKWPVGDISAAVRERFPSPPDYHPEARETLFSDVGRVVPTSREEGRSGSFGRVGSSGFSA